VKPENVIVSPVRLIDFSVGCRIGDRRGQQSGVGTPAYMAPEQLESGTLGTTQLGPPADIYALGTTLVEALTNQPAQHWVPDHMSDALRGALLATRSRVPSRRPSAPELAGVFEHELSLVAGGYAGNRLPGECPGPGARSVGSGPQTAATGMSP
jgi:serine/threonine protein kinase